MQRRRPATLTWACIREFGEMDERFGGDIRRDRVCERADNDVCLPAVVSCAAMVAAGSKWAHGIDPLRGVCNADATA